MEELKLLFAKMDSETESLRKQLDALIDAQIEIRKSLFSKLEDQEKNKQ